MKHFYYYPSIEYSDNAAVNIMVRGKIRNLVLQNTGLYYKFTVTNGMRPDIISTKYYGNTSFTWAIFYANNIFHPIHDWPMEEQQFNKYLEIKYGIAYPRGSLDKIHHYEMYDAETKTIFTIDENTYKMGANTEDGKKSFRAVSIYDYEFNMNEAKRNIVVLDQKYISRITNELNVLF